MSNFKGPNYNYLVLDTVQAAAADLQLAGGVISFGNPLQVICDYKNLIPGKCSAVAAVAETAQVSTLTFTAANSTDYGIRIDQFDPVNGRTITKFYYYTSDATATATEIATAFAAAINADTTIKVTAVGGATLVLTADAGYALFTVTNITDTTVANVLTTPGVVAKGTQAALALKGITVSGASYSTVHMEYGMNMTPVITGQLTEKYVLDIYLNQADGDTAALVTAFDNLFAGVAGGVANPEAIAVE